MKKQLTPETLAFIQQLVGGNSNPIAKLEALVPGLFSSAGSAQRGQSSRRFVGAEVIDGELVIETAGRGQVQKWRIRKVLECVTDKGNTTFSRKYAAVPV